MKPTHLRACLWVLLCGTGVSGMGALRPEGDKIEFSPPREELKVAPLTGSDLEGPTFNFQRREPGGSVSDVPSAVALPSPDQVNRMRALQELIEQRTSWARPEDIDEMTLDTDFQKAGSESELTIDDLFERQTGRSDRGFQRGGDRETSELDRSRDRDDGLDGTSRDRRGLNNRDPRDRNQSTERKSESDSGLNGLNDGSRTGDLNADGTDSGRKRRDGMGPTLEPGQRERRNGSDGLFEFGSLVPKTDGFLRDSSRESAGPADRLDSLRRVLGSSAPSILGAAGTKPGSGDGLTGPGVLGTLGMTPGVNRSLSQSLDARPGAGGVVPTAEGPGTGDRFTSIPNRPFSLDINSGRDGLSSRSDRMQLAPPTPSPMEMFRKKHDTRIPSREF